MKQVRAIVIFSFSKNPFDNGCAGIPSDLKKLFSRNLFFFDMIPTEA